MIWLSQHQLVAWCCCLCGCLWVWCILLFPAEGPEQCRTQSDGVGQALPLCGKLFHLRSSALCVHAVGTFSLSFLFFHIVDNIAGMHVMAALHPPPCCCAVIIHGKFSLGTLVVRNWNWRTWDHINICSSSNTDLNLTACDIILNTSRWLFAVWRNGLKNYKWFWHSSSVI